MMASPDLANSRSRLADWLELKAVIASHGAGQADLASVWRLSSDDHHEREADTNGDVLEEEILDASFEETVDRVSEEIGDRAQTLGDDYPFLIDARPFRISLREGAQLGLPQWTYLFLLLLSVYRDKALPVSEKLDALIRQGRTLFHACASVGVAGLLRNAQTVWFGWPRPDGTGFLRALADVCEKLGFGKAKEQVPAGLPEGVKDDQIDVIGWRKFRGQRAGNLLVLCQAATGSEWDDKSIIHHVDAFKQWFAIEPYARATSSIALPFPAHHEVDEHPEGFQVACHNALHRSQTRHGVLIDRLRIVEAVLDVNADAKGNERIGGIEKLPELKSWVVNALGAIQERT